MKHRGRSICIAALAVAVILLNCRTVQAQAGFQGRNDFLRKAFARVAEMASPFVLELRAEGAHVGYGVLIGREGYILTADSVVGKRSRFDALSAAGKRYDAVVHGRNWEYDLALLAIKGVEGKFPRIEMAPTSAVPLGQFVISVGTKPEPLAVGVVSATKREVIPRKKKSVLLDFFGLFDQSTGPKRSYPSILQHDSPIKRGLIGSPLVDARGRLLGINVASAYRGSSYAVGVDEIRANLNDLMRGIQRAKPKKEERGYLGVAVSSVSPEEQKAQGLQGGLLIEEVVPGHAAAKAGIKVGDIVIHVNGKRVTGIARLQKLIGSLKPGAKITLTILRGGKKKKVDVVLGEWPKDAK